jgi:hypothetical protein
MARVEKSSGEQCLRVTLILVMLVNPCYQDGWDTLHTYSLQLSALLFIFISKTTPKARLLIQIAYIILNKIPVDNN